MCSSSSQVVAVSLVQTWHPIMWILEVYIAYRSVTGCVGAYQSMGTASIKKISHYKDFLQSTKCKTKHSSSNLEWNWQNTEDLEQMAMVQINIFIYLQLSMNVDLSF